MFIGDASKVRRNLGVEDALIFLYAVKLEGAVCTADSFSPSVRFVIRSGIVKTISTTRLRVLSPNAKFLRYVFFRYKDFEWLQ